MPFTEYTRNDHPQEPARPAPINGTDDRPAMESSPSPPMPCDTATVLPAAHNHDAKLELVGSTVLAPRDDEDEHHTAGHHRDHNEGDMTGSPIVDDSDDLSSADDCSTASASDLLNDDPNAAEPQPIIIGYRVVSNTTNPVRTELSISFAVDTSKKAKVDATNKDSEEATMEDTWVSERQIHLNHPDLLVAFWAGLGGRSHALHIDEGTAKFEILRLCAHRGRFSVREFKVEWVGYPEEKT